MVAQDVETVFPSWVDEGRDGYKRLTFLGFARDSNELSQPGLLVVDPSQGPWGPGPGRHGTESG
jgi:hypothetical protein